MHQGNGQLLFILVVSYSFDFRMDRSNKDIVSVKHSFALYVDNTPLSVFSSLFSLYQSKVTYIASYCTVQALSSDFTVCSHRSLIPLLADVGGAAAPSPQIFYSPFLSLSCGGKDQNPVQSFKADSIADLKYRQLSFVPKFCP